MTRWGTVLVLLVAVWSVRAIAVAQSSSATDVVRLADGSFYRGTIIESTSDHVSLLLPSGETRAFARGDVASAGPEAPPQIAAPVVPAPTTHVHAATDGEDLTLHRSSATGVVSGGTRALRIDQFVLLCRLPCDVDLPSGDYQLGIAHGEATPSRVGQAITLAPGDLQLDVHHERRDDVRIAGWITIIGSVVAGAVLVGTAFVDGPSPCAGLYSCGHDVNLGQLIAGGAIFVIGLGVGFPLAFWNDGFEISASVGGVPITR